MRASLTFESVLAAASQPATCARVREPSLDKGLEIESEANGLDTAVKPSFSSEEDLVGLGILDEDWFPIKFVNNGCGILAEVDEIRRKKRACLRVGIKDKHDDLVLLRAERTRCSV